MYIGINLENIITIGVMLLCWMVVLHVAGQFGLKVSSLWGGS